MPAQNKRISVHVTVMRESGEVLATRLLDSTERFDIDNEAAVYFDRIERWLSAFPSPDGPVQLFAPKREADADWLCAIIDGMHRAERLYLTAPVFNDA